MVEMWQPNATLNGGVCKNNTGGEWEPWQLKRWDIGGGGLYNGMVLPYVHLLRGAYISVYVSRILQFAPVFRGSIYGAFYSGAGTST